MHELSRRIAELSPARRKLLDQLLAKREMHVSAAPLSHNQESEREPTECRRPPSSPTEAKARTRQFYNSVNAQLDSVLFGKCALFLNFGYVADQSPQYSRIKLPAHALNKNGIKLVLELLGNCTLAGCTVLDVGCGRGGTISVICQFFDAKSVTGIDLSSRAIAFCSKTHRDPRARFLEGDAEKLPFKDQSFDVVTNVESSHSYPEVHTFFREVFRVLKTGGRFFYTDLLPVSLLNDSVNVLRGLGFGVEEEREITANVLLSCDETARRHLEAFDDHNDPTVMREFLGLPGSPVYSEMKRGLSTYRIFKLTKPTRN